MAAPLLPVTTAEQADARRQSDKQDRIDRNHAAAEHQREIDEAATEVYMRQSSIQINIDPSVEFTALTAMGVLVLRRAYQQLGVTINAGGDVFFGEVEPDLHEDEVKFARYLVSEHIDKITPKPGKNVNINETTFYKLLQQADAFSDREKAKQQRIALEVAEENRRRVLRAVGEIKENPDGSQDIDVTGVPEEIRRKL